MDERRLDWKKPVRDYLPEFRLHDAVATDCITVRDLLRHHSGLPRHDWIWMPDDPSPAQMLAAMRYLERCTGTFSQGDTTVVAGQDNDGQLTLTVGSQPTYKRTFVIDELEGFRVEFHLGPDGEVNELFFHQPNGTFV